MQVQTRGLAAAIVTLSSACATPGMDVDVRKTGDFREIGYRSIAPGEAQPPEGYRRNPIPEALEAKAWDVMKIHLVPGRWEFSDVEGTDLVVYFGRGGVPKDRADEIGEDTLVVDVFERETGERVWRGFAEGLATLDAENVEAAISRMMLQFPRLPPRPVAY